MDNDEIIRVGQHVVPGPLPVSRLQGTVETPDISQNKPAGEAPLQLDDIRAFDQQELPWVTLAKWRKTLVLVNIFLGLFLSTLDTSIVATALVTIVTQFGDFARSPWIVLVYLLLYMSLSVAFARLSDVYGRKTMVLIAWIIFTAFSIGCGVSQTMTQLIAFRALQGVGGSGLFSLAMVMIPEVVSSEKMGITSAMVGLTLGCSGILGPILGGVISHFTTWRCIFYINIPLGCLSIATILIVWPQTPGLPLSSWAAFQSIDFFGIVLVLVASTMHIWSFEEVSVLAYEWTSPLIISLLTLAASCWVTFVIWQFFLESRKNSFMKPVFPFRIVLRRVMASAIFCTFLTGFPYIVTVVMLPERFQIVNGASSLMAGVYLLPLLGASAIGSYLGGAISSKKNYTSYTLIVSSLLQMAGCGLLSTIGNPVNIMPRQYVFEAILGLGIGMSLSTATIMTSVQAKQGDLAAAQGAVSQIRVLGGIIGVTITTTLFNRRSYNSLSTYLSSSELDAIHTSPIAVLSFPADQQQFVKDIYANLFSLQMRILMYICAVAVLASLASWEKNPPDIRKALEVHRRSGPPAGVHIEIPNRK